MKEYIKKNNRYIEILFVFSIICYGFMIFNHTISIDEDTWILSDTSPMFWFIQGRFGIRFFNDFFTNNGQYTPFLWDFLSVIIWSFSGVIFYYGIFGDDKDSLAMLCFSAYFTSLPCVVGAILSFSMFNLQISIAMLLNALGFVACRKYLELHRRIYFIWGTLGLVVSFSVYQAFIGVYITVVVAYCFYKFIQGERKLTNDIVIFAIGCICAVAIYYGINWMILKYNGIDSSTYLSDTYIGWGNGKEFLDVLFDSLKNIPTYLLNRNVTGKEIYAGNTFAVLNICFVVYLVYKLIKLKELKSILVYCFFSLAMLVAPFFIYILMGTSNMQGRQMLGLSVLGAVEVALILTEFKGNWKKIVFFFVGYILFLNVRDMNLLYYYGSIVYQHDKTIANEIMYDIKRLGADYHNKPVIFVGAYPFDNVPIQRYETVAGSIFEWDGGKISRIQNFFETEGYELLLPETKDINIAVQLINDMSTWPQMDSIREYDDFILVYLNYPTEQWLVANGATIE